ncbi:uncharacterized protein G2W53_006659 [Senna tora]|uniref:Uncharacterized protein n=1 Tax=Senna tora TaxID=362788 RepID=A0A834X4D7_9FABA|nr:uncharacterized protein G2W53_006659 [Senna tora]
MAIWHAKLNNQWDPSPIPIPSKKITPKMQEAQDFKDISQLLMFLIALRLIPCFNMETTLNSTEAAESDTKRSSSTTKMMKTHTKQDGT